MAESISEGVLSTFNRQVGDYVEQDEEIASIETDKIDVALNATHSGTITKLLVSEGDIVTGNKTLPRANERNDLYTHSYPNSHSTARTTQPRSGISLRRESFRDES
ncbi:hypothetical protein APSETT444_008486 [Aspergillus pseudonomiae]